MKRSMTRLEIQRSYDNLIFEQQPHSPHCYFSDDFFVTESDIVIDAGTAEGNFALSIIDKVSKIYLFEADLGWIEALEATFEPWKEKVIISNNFISNNDVGKNITLDMAIGSQSVDFIKADIEGAEVDMLRGMDKILSRQSNLKLVLCTYHHQSDEKDLSDILRKKGFSISPSEGYMILFDDPDFQAPYLRRGVIRVRKCSE
ncbi:MAG: FkbM family methyltransferase [Dysgonamonadaceae bacterium]|nr:FkbM family methyltransferase [Dysgonamonadaceae bacterium]